MNLTDICQRDRGCLQEQSDRLEGMQRMADRITHKLNNIIMVVNSYMQMAMENLPEDAPGRNCLDKGERSLRQLSGMVSGLEAFSGRATAGGWRCDMTQLLVSLSDGLEAMLPPSAALRFNPARQPLFFNGDPDQFRKMVKNIFQNAVEALGESGGTIFLTTGKTRYAENGNAGRGTCAADRRVFLEVIDTGCGMDPETLSRCLDPYYTTKGGDRGMGLSTVYGIVKEYNGIVDLDSRPGEGTRVRLCFPEYVDSPDRPEAVGKMPVLPEKSKGILIVDDHDLILNICRRLLEYMNYRVIVAADGNEAVEIFGCRAEEIGCAVIDLNLPGIGGPELCRKLRKFRPELHLIVTSGCSEEEFARKFEGEPRVDGFLKKPFKAKALAAMLEGLMGNESGGGKGRGALNEVPVNTMRG